MTVQPTLPPLLAMSWIRPPHVHSPPGFSDYSSTLLKVFFWKNTLARRGRMAAKRGSIPPIPPTWVWICAQTPWKCHFPLSVVPFFRALTFTSCFKSQFHLHWPLHSGRVCHFSLLLLTVLPARPSVLPSRLDLKREIVGAWGLAGRTDKATMWCEVPVSCS